MTTRPRYLVQYAHYDGNVYRVAEATTLCEAQDIAEQTRGIGFRRLLIFIIDRDNPERGDVSDVDVENE